MSSTSSTSVAGAIRAWIATSEPRLVPVVQFKPLSGLLAPPFQLGNSVPHVFVPHVFVEHVLRLDEVAARRLTEQVQPLPPLSSRQLHVHAHEAGPRRRAAAMDAFEVDENVRELFALALLIRHGEGRRTERSRPVSDPHEPGVAPHSGSLAPQVAWDGDGRALDQDRAVG